MSVEARALLDALMGPDRDAPLPPGTATARRDQWNSTSQRRGNKKSCYDRDICPFYCAWGVDVYELFTNTKSDLGPNPCVVQADARDEYLSLPEHEKNRLGYEHMLYRKLGDLVRNCDRVVARNKEKLRAEIARNAKARGAGSNVTSIDPVTAVKDEMILETAECIADIELNEEQVESLVRELNMLEKNEKQMYLELQELRKNVDHHQKENESIPTEVFDLQDDNLHPSDENGNILNSFPKPEEDGHQNGHSTNFVTSGTNKDISEDDTDILPENQSYESSFMQHHESLEDAAHAKGEDMQSWESMKLSEKISLLEQQLLRLFSEKQAILSSVSVITCTKLLPLRETLQNLQKQLHYVRSDTASDKSVCEISGNFMSSRDADERIAAHYAGKQYVGWKMVREKFKELHKKYSGVSAPPPRVGLPLPTNNYRTDPSGYDYSRGPPPNEYSRGPPSIDFNRGQPTHDYGSRDRPRSHGPTYQSATGGLGRSHGRRSPSPERWERDRGRFGNERSYGNRGGR